MQSGKVLAIDLGGSSGRVMLGEMVDSVIHLKEIHRFSNDPVMVNGTLYWDILRIIHEIKIGIVKSKPYGKIESLAIDTWGVDFGLIDSQGYLVDNPVHYRDKRTVGTIDMASKILDLNQLYRNTGNQIMEINTLFQFLALMNTRADIFSRTDKFLTIPALISFYLGAKPVVEASMASTTQLYDQEKKQWAWNVIEQFDIPKRIFPEIVESGTIIGELSSEICHELGVNPIKIIAGCSHDTQSAQMVIPSLDEEFLFISCGTWSLIGTEIERPVLTEKAMEYELTNEAAYDGKTSFMKNVIGLWMIQESRRQWKREGHELSYSELERLACEEQGFDSIVDPDSSEFISPGDIPERIKEYCRKTNQDIPLNIGQVVMCINRSLAAKYKKVKEEIETCTGVRYSRIFIVGGGSQSSLLCQLTADYCGVPVTSGPSEATVYGNVAAQLKTVGSFTDLSQVRRHISELEEICTYYPEA